MFNMSDFIKKNLIDGFNTGTFNEIQVNMFAFNYLNRGQINQEVFNEILDNMKPQEEFEE